MAFALTILYLMLSYLSLDYLAPVLAPYHIQVLVVALALVCAVPGLARAAIGRQPASYCLLAMLFFVAVSSAWNNGPGAGARAAEDFASSAVVLMLVVATCDTLRRIRIVAGSLALIAVYFVLRGISALRANDFDSPFLIQQHIGEGTTYIARIRGVSFVHDPNDFAQFLVCLIPLLWLWHKPNSRLWNIALVYLPAALFCFGLYLTHSRGGMIALILVTFLAVRKRLGSVLSGASMVAVAMGLMALNFTGGRAISDSAGADRMDAWSAGLAFVKSSPLLGIGYGRFSEEYEITAHNSFVLCISETGLLGYMAWLALIVATVMGARWVLKKHERADHAQENRAEPAAGGEEVPWPGAEAPLPDSLEDLHRSIDLCLRALFGFLAAAWFLSRAYVITLYLLLGLVTSLILCIRRREGWDLSMPALPILKATLTAGFLLMAVIYVIVRFHFAA